MHIEGQILMFYNALFVRIVWWGFAILTTIDTTKTMIRYTRDHKNKKKD